MFFLSGTRASDRSASACTQPFGITRMQGKKDDTQKNPGEQKGSAILYENLIDLDLRNGEEKEDPELDHRCQLFNTPVLLFDKTWTGSDEVRIELVTSTTKQAEAAAAAFRGQFKEAGLEGTVSIKNTSTKPHRNSPEGCSAVFVTDVKITKPVKPEPLLALMGVTLWIEPNKLEKMSVEERWNEIEGCVGENATEKADKIREIILNEMKRIEADQKEVLKALKRLQNFTQLPAKQTKGADIFRYLQKKRLQLKALASHAHGVTKLYTCSVCGCIIQAVGNLPCDKSVLDKLKPPTSKLTWTERIAKASATI
uniref:Uncharacterized protein n=1 Tax=Lotharella oceanica TaxID=641309 RepID=A0A7S2XFM6_9EUKA